MNNESVKETLEYRLFIVEQQLSLLKLQQDDFKQLGKELNNLMVRSQMSDLALSDVKERLDEHRLAMKTLREEIKEERAEFLAAQKEFQRDSTAKMEKIQDTLIRKLEELNEKSKPSDVKQEKSNSIINLSDATFQLVLRLMLAVLGVIATLYGFKIV